MQFWQQTKRAIFFFKQPSVLKWIQSFLPIQSIKSIQGIALLLGLNNFQFLLRKKKKQLNYICNLWYIIAKYIDVHHVACFWDVVYSSLSELAAKRLKHYKTLTITIVIEQILHQKITILNPKIVYSPSFEIWCYRRREIAHPNKIPIKTLKQKFRKHSHMELQPLP